MRRFAHHTTIAIALGLGVTLALLYILSMHPDPVLAAPSDLFVTMDGTGTACTQDTPCDLQTALSQVGGGDTIYVAQGSYTGTGSAVVTVTQSITLAGGWDGAPTGNVMRDPDTHPTTLDGEGQRRGVFISGTITTTLDGFIITGGNATGLGVIPYNQYSGGGICSVNASPIIINNVITHNLASTSTTTYGRGGGIHLANASATSLISGNLIVSNTASTGNSGYGGGISLYNSDATMWGNRVLSNTGSTAGYCAGGGIFVSGGNCSVVGNVIQGNTDSTVFYGSGGGLTLDNASALVRDNLIANNSSLGQTGGSGGGIRAFRSQVTLDGNRVVMNTAWFGGAMVIYQTSVTLTNNIIAWNHVISYAGGVRFWAPSAAEPLRGVMLHNTIADNDQEALYLDQYAVLTLTNNIIVSHTIGITASASTTATVDHTLFFDNDKDIAGAGTVASTDEITGSDPLFVDPAGWDYHILPGSPAIDAGATAPWLTTDIDGDARPWPPGGAYDIGADEARLLHVYLPLVLQDDNG